MEKPTITDQPPPYSATMSPGMECSKLILWNLTGCQWITDKPTCAVHCATWWNIMYLTTYCYVIMQKFQCLCGDAHYNCHYCGFQVRNRIRSRILKHIPPSQRTLLAWHTRPRRPGTPLKALQLWPAMCPTTELPTSSFPHPSSPSAPVLLVESGYWKMTSLV